MPLHPPIFAFCPYTLQRTAQVRSEREAMWHEINTRPPPAKRRKVMPGISSKHAATLAALPPGLDAATIALVLQSLAKGASPSKAKTPRSKKVKSGSGSPSSSTTLPTPNNVSLF